MTPMNKSIKCKMHVQASAVLGIKKSTIELLGVSNILSKRCTFRSLIWILFSITFNKYTW